MQQLSKAIIAQYNANADLKAALPNGLWDTEAPQGTNCPYGVFSMPGQATRMTFTDDVLTQMIQIKLYSDNTGSSAPLDGILIKLLAAFNYCQLTVEDYTFLSMYKVNVLKNKNEATRFWEYLVMFQVMLAENRIE
jgi:hypothetical protein